MWDVRAKPVPRQTIRPMKAHKSTSVLPEFLTTTLGTTGERRGTTEHDEKTIGRAAAPNNNTRPYASLRSQSFGCVFIEVPIGVAVFSSNQ
jgi:hypothetical protein